MSFRRIIPAARNLRVITIGSRPNTINHNTRHNFNTQLQQQQQHRISSDNDTYNNMYLIEQENVPPTVSIKNCGDNYPVYKEYINIPSAPPPEPTQTQPQYVYVENGSDIRNTNHNSHRSIHGI